MNHFLTLDLLDGPHEPTTGQKRKHAFDDGRSASKFRITESDEEASEDFEDELAHESESSGESDEDGLKEESEFKGFSDSSDSEPEEGSDPQSGRYVPPAARKVQAALSTHEEDPRLRKQIQGMLNR